MIPITKPMLTTSQRSRRFDPSRQAPAECAADQGPRPSPDRGPDHAAENPKRIAAATFTLNDTDCFSAFQPRQRVVQKQPRAARMITLRPAPK
jgi:hypothetical protein